MVGSPQPHHLDGLGGTDDASTLAHSTATGLKGFLHSFGAQLKDVAWWAAMAGGAFLAYQQGFLPFLQPSRPATAPRQPVPGGPHAPLHPHGPAGLAGSGLHARTAAGAHAGTAEEVQHEPSTEEEKAALEALAARAQQHATEMKDGKVTIEHMVLALADNPRFAEILQCAEGLSQEQFKAAIRKSRVLFNRGEPDEELVPEVQTALGRYARDLTAAARAGTLDPLVGRADEMRRIIHILCRRTKNNPVILGEPGVGKTALVEGLAARIAAGDVPEPLQGVQLMALDMGLLMAGAFMPGEFEERLKGVLKELTATNNRFVLFIDDLHNVTGPNAAQGGGMMDASVLLKPLLGRGELRCIGATSPDKYKKFIEKDPALERRFQQVTLQPPSIADSVSILRGLRARLERHHAVRISDSALLSAASLSERYITDRYLPDKALDLVDEASARVRVEMSLKPELLDKVERRVSALEAERRLLRRSAHFSKADELALQGVEEELASLRAQRTEMFERYQVEKSQAVELVAIQQEIDKLTDEIEEAEGAPSSSQGQSQSQSHSHSQEASQSQAAKPTSSSSSSTTAASTAGAKQGQAGMANGHATAGDQKQPETEKEVVKKPLTVEEVAKLSVRRSELVQKMRGLQDKWLSASSSASKGGNSNAKKGVTRAGRSSVVPLAACGEVGEPDIARVISDWTGIPLTKLVETEVDKVLHMADELHKRIIGQEEAVAAVAEAIQRSRAGMKDPNGPIASFLFLGPTGVGKTELAKALASVLFNSEDSMIRLDMSEYMEKHAVSKLIGAPPGYVGFDEGGQLTEKVRHRPYSVILFDEVEKAHVDVFNVLLQILDDGRVTDGQGRLVSFKNSLIIMTSNLGSQEVYRHTQAAKQPEKEKIKELVMEQVRKHFRPEFVNRVDEFIIFDSLRADQMSHIVSLRLRGVVSRLAEKRIRLVVAPRAMAYLAAKGFDPVFGGRPVRRVIQRELETSLARALLRGDFAEEDAVLVGLTGTGPAAELSFTRVAGGGTPAGAAAVEAALTAETAKDAAEVPPTDNTKAKAAGVGGADVVGDAAGVTQVLGGLGPRNLKFDPLKKISTLAESGVDVSQDGHAARADPDSLPPNAN